MLRVSRPAAHTAGTQPLALFCMSCRPALDVFTGARSTRLSTHLKLTASQGSHSYNRTVGNSIAASIQDSLRKDSARKRDFTTCYKRIHFSAHQPTFRCKVTGIGRRDCTPQRLRAHQHAQARQYCTYILLTTASAGVCISTGAVMYGQGHGSVTPYTSCCPCNAKQSSSGRACAERSGSTTHHSLSISHVSTRTHQHTIHPSPRVKHTGRPAAALAADPCMLLTAPGASPAWSAGSAGRPR
jgi:hypothetical protein